MDLLTVYNSFSKHIIGYYNDYKHSDLALHYVLLTFRPGARLKRVIVQLQKYDIGGPLMTFSFHVFLYSLPWPTKSLYPRR